MARTLEYIIEQNMNDHALSEMLRAIGFSEKNIIVLKRHREALLINDQPALLKYRLKTGDRLTIHMVEEKQSEKIPAVYQPLDIIYEDEDIMVVNKPAFMPIHPSMKNYENSLANAVAYYFKNTGEPFVYRCINRLDRDTTGLTILAKHMLSASVLYDEMTNRMIHREYVAIVEGALKPQTGTINKPLGKKPDSGIERMVDYENGEEAITDYEVMEYFSREGKDYSYVRFSLKTGRTHQIRVHMASEGHPLIGDFLYNPQNSDMDRQALHAGKIEFVHPISREKMILETPIPNDMASFLSV